MKKIYSILLIGCFIISGIQAAALHDDSEYKIINIDETIVLSEPTLIDNGDFISISIMQATSSLKEVGKPMLPMVTKVYVLPFGSKIEQISLSFTHEKKVTLNKDINPFYEPDRVISDDPTRIANIKDTSVYDSNNIYPFEQYEYQLVSGLENDEHVFYLIVHCYPAGYIPKDDILCSYGRIDISITYQKPKQSIVFPDEYDLVIISPDEYTDSIIPLIDHKQGHSLTTFHKTIEDIYSEYPGRDEAEQIKYFIKDAVETLGIDYVLLVGSVYKLPIRTSAITLWDRWEEDTLTDLYYSDIYDGNSEFSSWDSDEDNIFGETKEDQLDLYPDVHIGRLACDTVEEVNIVVDKIIHYEDETFGQNWFHDMIFIGGNTFRWNPGYEGEDLNEMIMDIMTDFNPSYIIWTSKGNFNRRTISEAINAGAGFLDYSGHGFEHGMGTYPPHGPYLKTYLTPYINDLVNGYKLPIIFFDACLTAKLDFVLQDLLDYKQYRIFDILARIINYDTQMKLPCYAWYFIKHDGGGAIATIGATRTAFGGVDSGAGKMSLEFFKNYDGSQTVGQMMTKAQNAYITDVPEDQFTVEEFILLGDPSLRIGGYP